MRALSGLQTLTDGPAVGAAQRRGLPSDPYKIIENARLSMAKKMSRYLASGAEHNGDQPGEERAANHHQCQSEARK
jgi:hypothetical protein